MAGLVLVLQVVVGILRECSSSDTDGKDEAAVEAAVAARLLQLAAQRSQAALTAAQLLAPSPRQVREAMLPSLPRVSQPSTPRTPQQHVTTHKWPPQYRRQPPGTGRQRLSRSLCAGKAARGQFGRPALFGLRFTALHCASDGSRAGATHFFSLPKKVQLGSFLTGLESPPRRCRGSCRRLTTSARRLRAWKCQEPRCSVYLVGGGFSWSPQAAAAARSQKLKTSNAPACQLVCELAGA